MGNVSKAASRNSRTIRARFGEKTQYLSCESNDSTVRFAVFYEAPLQPELLQQAVSQLATRIDILHASFLADESGARWVIHGEYDPSEAFCVIQTEDLTQAVHTALVQPIPFDGTLQLHCTLITDGKASAVVLRVGHMCADGGDTRYLMYKLIELYNCLLEGRDPASVELKNGSRNPEQCCRHLTLRDRLKLYKNPASGAKTQYCFPDEAPGEPRLMTRTLTAERIAAARTAGKRYGASVNDLLLAAFYRAAARQLAAPAGQPMGIQMMIDLRRYVPDGDSLGVCVLSGSAQTQLAEGVTGSFAVTLQEIVEQTQRSKNDRLAGLYDFPLMSMIFRLLSFGSIRKLGARAYGGATMGLTNMGALKAELLTAGGLPPQQAIFGGPVKRKPAFQIAAVGLNGAVTLCSAVQCTQADAQAVQALLTMVEEELETFCSEEEKQC